MNLGNSIVGVEEADAVAVNKNIPTLNRAIYLANMKRQTRETTRRGWQSKWLCLSILRS